jgi:flavin reductase (DIM6/NTAB) family NADH-FMN oxidoreductase RutF
MTSSPTVGPAVDPATVREIHRRFVTGVTIVAVDDAGTPRGLAVNAFCSISLDPPLVMACVQKTSSTYPCLFRAGHLAVSILAAGQADVAAIFATKHPDKFASIAWSPALHGSPLIDGSCAAIEVEIRERLQASTHSVFIGRVVDARYNDADPLIYRAGQFYEPARLTPLRRAR